MPTASAVTRSTPSAEPTARLTVTVDGVELERRFAVKWQDIGSAVGNGEFALLRTDVQIADCPIGGLVMVTLDGDDVFAWRIDSIEDTVIDADEEAAEVTVFSGPSLGAILDDVIVYPSKGVYEVDYPPALADLRVVLKPTSPDRSIGWMEPAFDDGDWSAAVEVLDIAGPFRPEGFPNPGQWIWHEAAVDDEHDVGAIGLFRDTFTPVSPVVFAVKIVFAALEQVDVYLDGVLLAHTDPATDSDVGQHAREVVCEINGDLPHTLAFKVSHLVEGLAGLAYVVYEHNTGTVLAESSSSTLALDGTTEPGMNAGAILTQLIQEGYDRGCVPDITMSFNDTDDSNSNPFPSIDGDFAVRVGDTLLDVLQQLTEGWCEWAIGPGGDGQLLQLWVADGLALPGGGTSTGRGTDSGVEFEQAVNCTGFTYRELGQVKNWVLTDWGDGQLDGGDTGSVSTWGRRESFLSLGNVNSGVSAVYTSFATLSPHLGPQQSVIVEIAPVDTSDEPYSAFNIGDRVTAPNRAGTPTEYRVAAITCEEDDDGELHWFPELATAWELYEQQQTRWLRRTGHGAFDGRSRSASPSSRHIISAGKVNVVEVSFSTGGGGEMLIGDRGTPYRPRESTLFYRLEIEADVAGVTDDTSAQLYIDTTGLDTVTCPDSEDTGFTDMDTPVLATPLNVMNVEGTEEGGHTGVTVTALGMPTA